MVDDRLGEGSREAREGQRKPSPRGPYSSPADATKEGMGRNSGSSSSASAPITPLRSSASASCSSSRSRRSRSFHSDTSLRAAPSSRGGTSLPTSVEAMKPSTACPHLLPASRSRIFHRLFLFLVSFTTSVDWIFCCLFHSGHTLKRWSLVCEGHGYQHHRAVRCTLAQCRYCPVRACPVFTW